MGALRSVILSAGLAGTLSAALVNYNPAPTTDTGWTACSAFAGYSCRTTAFFDPLGLSDQNDDVSINGLFQSAFTAWNASGGGQGWTLNYGGNLGGTWNVTIAQAEQFDAANNLVLNNVFKGGLEINIAVTGVTLPTLGVGDQLVWTQGLFDNYLGNGTIVTPFYEMDIITAGCSPAGPNPYCPPAYPYQYADNRFYDQPKARYPGTRVDAGFLRCQRLPRRREQWHQDTHGLRRGLLRLPEFRQPRARGMGPAEQRTAGDGRDPAQNGKSLTTAGGPSVKFARPSPKSR